MHKERKPIAKKTQDDITDYSKILKRPNDVTKLLEYKKYEFRDKVLNKQVLVMIEVLAQNEI